MRILRVPYIYLTTSQVNYLHLQTHRLLNIVRDIHLDIPNDHHNDETARHYQYYPAFLRWAHDKAAAEMISRGVNHKSPLSDNIRNLRSRGLDYFLPPTDMEIAEDTVYLLEQWKRGRHPGGLKMPQSYLELVQNVYGYTPNEESLQGVGEVPGHHYHSDSGWYHIQGET